MGNNKEKETFYLGLTMAGAVSAGAYTGGVMDYLFEILDKWEKAKNGNLEGIDLSIVPKHDVVIEAMGGTSAGGMATIMSALYAIKNEINPVTDEQVNNVGKKMDNIFYDSWVNLAEKKGEKTSDQLLAIDDLKEGKIKSLLNSKFLDQVAENAFKLEGDPNQDPAEKIPSYISKDLEVLISHTMLRGIPLEVKFPNTNKRTVSGSSHASYDHFLFSHFKLDMTAEEKEKQLYLWLNPFEEKAKKHLLKAAVSTGAFPIGLSFRDFDKESFSEEYLKTILSRLAIDNLGEPNPSVKGDIDWSGKLLKSIISDYKTVTVDGGAINNEPYREVLSILERDKSEEPKQKSQYTNYGMIMIDPFPDSPKIDKEEPYENPDDIIGVTKNIIGTLWNQSKVKREEFAGQFDNSHIFRGCIFPRKLDENRKPFANPIASGSLAAFGGLLNINFRHHDFYLGRNNARNFARAFFSMPYFGAEDERTHPIHKAWTSEMVERFKVEFKRDSNVYLPIIPDMNLLLDNVSPNNIEQALEYSIPEMPKISKNDVEKLKPGIKKRVARIFDVVKSNIKRGDKIRFWQLGKAFKGLIISIIIKRARKEIINAAGEKAIEFIKKDLCKNDVLKKPCRIK